LAVDIGVVRRRKGVEPKGPLGIGDRILIGAEANLRPELPKYRDRWG
jgi:hypothetical protein